MILTYKQCIDKYGSDYMLKKEIAEGRVFQKEKGVKRLRKIIQKRKKKSENSNEKTFE